METEKIKHYYVPTDKIGYVLLYLNAHGWQFKDSINSSSIESGYVKATSRDWDGHKCVFRVEKWKGQREYKFISITSDKLMEANKQNDKIHSYEDFKMSVGLVPYR